MRGRLLYRDYRDFYSQRTDQSTGTGHQRARAGVRPRADREHRRSEAALQGVTVQGDLSRSTSRTDIGGTYTLSQTWGNFDGENVASGPLAGDDLRVSGVPAGVVELPGRRFADRSAAPGPPVDELRRAEA